ETPADKAPDCPPDQSVLVAGSKTKVAKGDITPKQEPKLRKMPQILAAFLPNRAVSPGTMRIIVGFQIALFLLVWITSPFAVLPQPGEVLTALRKLWLTEGLGPELIQSFKLNVYALILSSLISLGLSYLTVLPFFRPLAAAVSKGRF